MEFPRVNPFWGREATAPSVIRKIREVQRREEAPPMEFPRAFEEVRWKLDL
jgi:hypothetical protein